MKKNYYLFNAGRLSRTDNTLKFMPSAEDGAEAPTARYIPVESIDNFYVFGSLDANSALYNFLGKNNIALHFFDYYEHYTGSFMPKDYLLAGKMQIEQTKTYLNNPKRQKIAQKFIEGAAFNILKNLKYYQNRGKDLSSIITGIEGLQNQINTTTEIPELMGIEGNIRQHYYRGFDVIVNQEFNFGTRTKRPATNEMNALMSFGNALCYAACLSCIHHTQLNPTIGFLHQPGYRRYSLALDISEIFKPLLVDRTIFKVLNKKIIQENDFMTHLNGCVLKDAARKVFVRAFEEKLSETFEHRTLKRAVSYKHLIKLECYKLTKHILNLEEYKPFKVYW